MIDKKEIIQSLDEEFAADFLLNMLNVIKEQKKVDLSALIDRNFFEQVTEEQIKKIKQKNPKLMDCPAYYKTYFQYKYGYKISKFKNN